MRKVKKLKLKTWVKVVLVLISMVIMYLSLGYLGSRVNEGSLMSYTVILGWAYVIFIAPTILYFITDEK